MIAAQFIFRPGTYDDEFYRLDDSIEEFVASLPGFLGVDKWVSPDGQAQNSIYYFDNADTLKTLSRYPDHLVAKRGYQNWYDGYEIIVSEVLYTHGDKTMTSIPSKYKATDSSDSA